MATGTTVKRWLMVAGGIALVVGGLWLVWPGLIVDAWRWIEDHPGGVTTVAGLAAVLIGFGLIRRGLKKSN